MAGLPPSPRVVQLKVEVHMDVLCPWSYMQKQSLERAMARFQQEQPAVVFDVVWRPYYIHALLKSGIEKPALYAGNSTSRDRWDRLTLAGSQYDIRFRCTGTTGSSRDAHKLILLALRERGSTTQAQVVGDLFRGHFEEGRDIMDRDWLVQVAQAAGIGVDVSGAAVACDRMGHTVDEAVRAAMRGEGITAVPCVTVQAAMTGKRYRVGGFQHGSALEDVLRRIYAEGSALTLPRYQDLVAKSPAA